MDFIKFKFVEVELRTISFGDFDYILEGFKNNFEDLILVISANFFTEIGQDSILIEAFIDQDKDIFFKTDDQDFISASYLHRIFGDFNQYSDTFQEFWESVIELEKRKTKNFIKRSGA